MLIIKQQPNGVDPELRCSICAQPLPLLEAFLASGLDGRSDDQGQMFQPARWIHRRCLSGNSLAVFGSQRVVLWRAADLLARLMRQTETRHDAEPGVREDVQPVKRRRRAYKRR
jgi:hypothetical protein